MKKHFYATFTIVTIGLAKEKKRGNANKEDTQKSHSSKIETRV